MGPDATGVGQVFWYTVEGPSDPDTLRSIQDWFIRYQLNSVRGLAGWPASVDSSGSIKSMSIQESCEQLGGAPA